MMLSGMLGLEMTLSGIARGLEMTLSGKAHETANIGLRIIIPRADSLARQLGRLLSAGSLLRERGGACGAEVEQRLPIILGGNLSSPI